MSIRDYEEVINCTNLNNHDCIVLRKNDEIESNLVLSSLSIRDFKMLQFIKQALKDKQSVSISIGYSQ